MIDNIIGRLDRVQKIPPQYLSEAPPAPISVKIELSPRCNYRCAYCALIDRKSQPHHDMDWNLFKKITKDMRESGVEEIGLFFIGESFINPSLLIESIRYLKKELYFPYVFLTTNGSIAFPKFLVPCMEAGLDSLKWSCNAGNDEQFEKMTGVSATNLRLAVNNIRMAYEIRQDRGYSTKLSASSIRYDDSQHKVMEEFLSESVIPYVDKHYWLPLYSMAGFAKGRENAMGLTPVAGNTGRLDDPVPPIPCWLLFTSGHVMADGRLTACGYDSTGKWEVGDLKSQSFMEAWNSYKFKELRRAHLVDDIFRTKCAECMLY